MALSAIVPTGGIATRDGRRPPVAFADGTARCVPLTARELSLDRLTTAQAVASGAASLLLFAATAGLGYALAAGRSAAPSAVPVGRGLHAPQDHNGWRIQSRPPRRQTA